MHAEQDKKRGAQRKGDNPLKLNLLKLEFSGKIEQEFRKYYFDAVIKIVRIAVISGLLYYASFAVLDLIAVKESFQILSLIRFGVVCPLVIVIIFLSFTKGFRKYFQLALIFAVLISGLGVVAMTIVVPGVGRNDYYVGIILVLIYCYLLTRLRVGAATFAGWVISLSYVASLIIFPGVDKSISSVNVFFLLTTNVLGMFGAYLIEYYMRLRFSSQYLLEEEKHKVANANMELEAKVVEKTAELQAELKERKQVAEELMLAKEKAEESDRLKTAFLTNMSHEIRTPMNGILGFSNLLKSKSISADKQRMYIDMIEKSGDRMLTTLNDLINISKIEAGLMTLVHDIEDVNKMLSEQHLFFKNEAESKGLRFIYKPAIKDEPLEMLTDREKFISVITNLLKNAIKFTDEGYIEYGYHIRKEAAEKELEFYVIDTGSGIPVNRQKNIFDRFVQVEAEYNRASEGFGLGLSIAEAYTEMLGGRIWLNTDYQEGAEFRFTIPVVVPSDNQLL